MDKDILALIGKLYLENMGLANMVESLRNRVAELETLVNNTTTTQTPNSSSKSKH